jgi:hypothetical protein
VIVGAVWGCVTVSENAARDAEACPSLTLIAMFEKVPAAVGVPDSCPVVVLNAAQVGLFATLNVSVVPVSGSLAVGVNVYSVPTLPVVGGVPEIVGGRFGCVTTIENAGNDADACPSLTLIAMFANVPAAVGVPDSCPVLPLNVAQAGRFVMLNVSVVPVSGSLAVGVNVYSVPTLPVVGGVPEIVGGRFGCVTTIENAGSDAVACPSLTLIAMFANVPAAVGVPDSCPVVVLNAAQVGLFATLKVSVVPVSGSLAVGVKAYRVPTLPVVGGLPEIVGGEFDTPTVIENAGNATLGALPSLTLIAMFEKVPAAVGVPRSCPVDALNVAQVGRFAMLNVSVSPSASLAVGVKE